VNRFPFQLAIAASLATLPVQVAAAPSYPGFMPFSTAQAVTIRPDRGYLLLRSGNGTALMRVPSSAEQGGYRSQKLAAIARKGAKAPPYDDFTFAPNGMQNLYVLWNKKPFEVGEAIPVQLIEVEPGDYILYGVSAPNVFLACYCFGTVGFSARAGEITDIGTHLMGQASEPSPFPELASETNIGVTARGDFPATAGALRPYRQGDRIPPAIAGMPRVTAEFHAVGPYLEPSARNVNRLAAIPGVLAYDRGKVIDVQTGKVVGPQESHFSAIPPIIKK
jgi:hypothetical protein